MKNKCSDCPQASLGCYIYVSIKKDEIVNCPCVKCLVKGICIHKCQEFITYGIDKIDRFIVNKIRQKDKFNNA